VRRLPDDPWAVRSASDVWSGEAPRAAAVRTLQVENGQATLEPATLAPCRAGAMWVGAVGLAVFAFVALTWGRYASPDTYVSLAAGRWIVEHGIPHTEPMTHAGLGRPWVDQQWLGHIGMYAVWRAGGYPLLGAVSALLIASAFAIFAATMRWWGIAPGRVAIWSAAAFAVCMTSMGTRTQSAAYPLFAGALWMVLADWRRPRPRRLALLSLPLLVLWANVHGSAVMAAGLLATYSLVRALRRRDRSYAALTAFAALAPLATPYGLDIIGYYDRVLTNPAIARHTTEWKHAALASPFTLSLVVVALIAVAAWRRRVAFDPLFAAATLVLAVAGIQAIRYELWYAFPASLLGADLLQRLDVSPAQRRAGSRPALAAGIAALTAALAGALTLAGTPAHHFERTLPTAAVDRGTAYLHAHPGAALMTDGLVGSGMLWHQRSLAGRIAFDGRIEVLAPDKLDELTAFLHRPSASTARVLDGYDALVLACFPQTDPCEWLERRIGEWQTVRWRGGGLYAMRREP